MKHFSRLVFLLAFVSAVAACQRNPSTHAANTIAGPAPAAPASADVASNAFTVEITLSPAARERLTARQESLIANAEYFGEPSAQAQAQHVPGSENPWLTLHRAQIELDGSQLDGTVIARFPAVVLDPGRLAWTDAPDAPQVNINVYSGRRSSPDNLLECGMFQDALAIAARGPIKVSCGLIGEPGAR